MKMTIVLLALLLAGCDALTHPESARKVLLDAGYSDVKFTGYDWFACSKDDTYHTGFTAKGPTGRPVKGVVCEGVFFKASTIRLD